MTISQMQTELDTYMGLSKMPDDFKDFWEDRTTKSAKDIRIEPVAFANEAAVYEKMEIKHDGRTICARIIRPAMQERYPLILMFHDLNRGIRGWHHMTRFIGLGYAVAALEEEDDQVDWKQEPEHAAFTRRYTDALIFAKIAAAMPFVETEMICTWGEGLGGGLAIAAAAMLPDCSKCMALNPLPADFRRVCPEKSEEIQKKLEYVDISNFASLVHSAVLLGTGLMDQMAPPEIQYAIYNRLHSSKKHLTYPKYEHERINTFENEVMKFLVGGKR